MIPRLIFLALLVYAGIVERYDMVLFNGIIFIVTLIFPYLARHDKEYSTLENAMMSMFSLSLLVALFFSWEAVFILRVDTIFHMTGGAFVAWFAAIYYKKLKDPIMYAVTIIFATIAIGAGWEVFEWIFSKAPAIFNVPFNPLGLDDTMKDLVADTLGACVVVFVRLRHKLFK